MTMSQPEPPNPSVQLRMLAANLQTVARHGASLSAADIAQHADKLLEIAGQMKRIETTVDELVAESMADEHLKQAAIASADVLPFRRRNPGSEWTRHEVMPS
jgi:hypothetical protein